MFRRKIKNQNVGRRPLNRQPRSGSYSYYSASKDGMDKITKSAPEATGKKRQKKRPLIPIVLVLVIIFIGFYETFLNDRPKIIIQKSPDAGLMQSASVYSSFAQKQIDKSFSNRNKITLNTSSIDSALEKQYPEIDKATMSVPLLGHTPVINIVPANISLILLESQGQEFALSHNGIVVDRLNPLLQNAGNNIPVITDQSGLNVVVGKQTLPQSYVSFTEILSSQLQAKKIKTTKWTLSSDGELDVYVSGSSYFVKFNLNDSAHDKQQIGDFLAVMQYMKDKNIKPAHYIDARIPGRAYYK